MNEIFPFSFRIPLHIKPWRKSLCSSWYLSLLGIFSFLYDL